MPSQRGQIQCITLPTRITWQYKGSAMEDGLSLRPLTLRPGGAGPGKNPFASFGRGAGASLAKKVSALHE